MCPCPPDRRALCENKRLTTPPPPNHPSMGLTSCRLPGRLAEGEVGEEVKERMNYLGFLFCSYWRRLVNFIYRTLWGGEETLKRRFKRFLFCMGKVNPLNLVYRYICLNFSRPEGFSPKEQKWKKKRRKKKKNDTSWFLYSSPLSTFLRRDQELRGHWGMK